MNNLMKEISESVVEDKDIMAFMRDYAVPRIRIMRAMNALKQMCEPLVKDNKIPGFAMTPQEYRAFRKMLNDVARSESLALAFEPETERDPMRFSRMGTLFGFMPVVLKDDGHGTMAFDSGKKE